MVRIKHRYLLAHILSPSTAPLSPTASALPPTVQFRPPTPNDLTPQLFLRAIREQVGLLYGDYGAGVTAAGLSIKYLSPATATFILRCPRAHYQLVWAALTYMTHLPAVKAAGGADGAAGERYRKARLGGDARPCVIRVVRVSGTVRKAEEEAVRRARGDILRARRGEVGGGGLEGWFGVVVDEDVDGDGGDEDDGEGESEGSDEEEEED